MPANFRHRRRKRRVWNLTITIMETILADFFCKHKSHDAWWYKIKIDPNAPSTTTKESMSPTVECPGEHSLSQLLGIPMYSLWQILIDCKLAKKTKGTKGNHLLDRKALAHFIINHDLDNTVELAVKDKQPVIRVGTYTQNTTQNDHSARSQWRSSKTPPRKIPCIRAFYLPQKYSELLGWNIFIGRRFSEFSAPEGHQALFTPSRQDQAEKSVFGPDRHG